jgi:hypothetical protein
MEMNENQILISLILGILPYWIRRTHETGGEWTLTINALFWSLTIHRRWDGRRDWTLRVPLINKLADAIWAAIMRLRDKDDDEPKE